MSLKTKRNKNSNYVKSKFCRKLQDDFDDDRVPADEITIEVNGLESECPEKSTLLSSNNLNVIRRPQLVKFTNNKEFREIVRIKHGNKIAKREKKKPKSPPVHAMRQVVTDIPEEGSKLKRPGPFQVSNKISIVEKPSELPGWVKKLSQQMFQAPEINDEYSIPRDANVNKSLVVNCQYCGAGQSTLIELDLHIIAQHKHEAGVQKQPLSCLEKNCSEVLKTLFELKQHLKLFHSFELKKKFYTFQSMNEFLNWKNVMEASTGTRFLYFSSFSEVTGGTTKVYVCSNDGTYDHNYLKHSTHRNRARVKLKESKKGGRACPAQLLVRSWGWGAIEVDAQVLHYGHDKPIMSDNSFDSSRSAIVSQSSITSESSRRPLSASSSSTVAPCKPEREDGVRIIEGSLIGDRGMDGLQHDLARWGLVDNVSICLCKRLHESNSDHLVPYNGFALGFTTNDQLDIWAEHGHRAMCLDSCKVSTGASEVALYICVLLVVDGWGNPLPVAWLFSTNCSEALLKYFLMCCKTAYESFHNMCCPNSNFIIGDVESCLPKNWADIYKHTGKLIMANMSLSKNWMAALNKVQDLEKREQVFEELFSLSLLSDECEVVQGIQEAALRYTADPSLLSFGSYITDQWIPHLHSVGGLYNSCSASDRVVYAKIYSRILSKTFKFVYVQASFSVDFDDCVSQLHNYTQSVLKEHLSRESIGVQTVQQEELIAQCHGDATTLEADRVVAVGSHSWRVRCSFRPDKWYNVRRQVPKKLAVANFKNMCSPDCKQVCWHCQVCYHQYTCTCPDNTIFSTICVHIHLIRICMRNPRIDASASSRSNTCVISDDDKLLNSNSSKQQLRLSIQRKCDSVSNILTHSVDKLSTDVLSEYNQQLDSILTSLQHNLQDQDLYNPVIDQHDIIALHKNGARMSTATSADDIDDHKGESMAIGDSGVTYQAVVGTQSTTGDTNEILDMEYACDLSDLAGAKGLLVLQEENGRYRILPQGEQRQEDDVAVEEVIVSHAHEDKAISVLETIQNSVPDDITGVLR